MAYNKMTPDSRKWMEKHGYIKKKKRPIKSADLVYIEDGKITEVLTRDMSYSMCAGLKKHYAGLPQYKEDDLRIITEHFKEKHKLNY